MHERGLKTSFAEEAVWLRSDRMNFCLTLPRSLAVKLLNYLLNCNYQLSTLHVQCWVIYFFSYTSAGLSCFCNQCFLISLCVLQINYLTSLLPNTFNSGSDLTLYKLTVMWKIVHNASLLASNNRLQLVVLKHESQASDLRIFWEIIEKKSTSP